MVKLQNNANTQIQQTLLRIEPTVLFERVTILNLISRSYFKVFGTMHTIYTSRIIYLQTSFNFRPTLTSPPLHLQETRFPPPQ